MDSITEALIHTPLWVYILFIYLIIKGISASKPQVTPLKVLFYMPIIFLVLSIETLVTLPNLNLTNVINWFLGLIIGGVLGWLQISRAKIKVDKKKKLVHSGGSWTVLIIILIIFVTKYYFNYTLALNPEVINNTLFIFSMLTVSGICSGAFIGRLAKYLHYFKTGPFI